MYVKWINQTQLKQSCSWLTIYLDVYLRIHIMSVSLEVHALKYLHARIRCESLLWIKKRVFTNIKKIKKERVVHFITTLKLYLHTQRGVYNLKSFKLFIYIDGSLRSKLSDIAYIGSCNNLFTIVPSVIHHVIHTFGTDQQSMYTYLEVA